MQFHEDQTADSHSLRDYKASINHCKRNGSNSVLFRLHTLQRQVHQNEPTAAGTAGLAALRQQRQVGLRVERLSGLHKGSPLPAGWYSETPSQTDKTPLTGSITNTHKAVHNCLLPQFQRIWHLLCLCKHQACKCIGTDTSKISTHIKNFKETYK